MAGAAAFSTALGAKGADIATAQAGDYEVWTVTSSEVYDLSDGETLSNVLVDQTHPDGSLMIRSRGKTDWTVKNVGFLGVGHVDGGSRFHFQVSAPSGGRGLIENVWMSGKARDGQSATSLGGIWLRPSHAGHVDIRNTWIEGFGNNAVYGSGVGKDGHSEGSVTIENAYHRDNTVSQFRIGSPDSVVRNSVGVVNDPEGKRGGYPGSGSQNARGVWGKHFPGQRIENCAFHVDPGDVNTGGAFEGRYIDGRSNGPRAEVEIVDCDLNADAPTLKSSTSNATVNVSNLGNSPTVQVIGGGGVPTSPKMAARGEREMPPEVPSASGSSSSSSSDTGTDHKTLTIDGRDADYTAYSFTVDGDLEGTSRLGVGDSVDGSTGSGFVNGGTDEFRFTGSFTEFTVSGNATFLVDGEVIDPATVGATVDRTLVVDGTDAGYTDYEFTVTGDLEATNSLGTGDSVDGSTGSGFVNGGTDEYRFSGELKDLTVSGDATVLVDGEPVDAADSWHDLQVAATGSRTIYAFEVSGELKAGDTADATENVGASAVSGVVAEGDVDQFRFTGDLTDFTAYGDLELTVDGQTIDPSQV